ncbi:stressosome-associated protein Prli42 [uncultured Gemella sp.]
MNKKVFKIVLWLMIFCILASGFISAIAMFLK